MTAFTNRQKKAGQGEASWHEYRKSLRVTIQLGLAQPIPLRPTKGQKAKAPIRG